MMESLTYQEYRYAVTASLDPAFRDVVRGVFAVKGELYCLADALEFRYRESGLFKSGEDVKHWRISFDDIRDLRFRGIDGRLIIAPRSLDVLDGLPGENEKTVKFKTTKSDRQAAREIAAYIRGEVSDRSEFEVSGVPVRLPELDTTFTEVRGILKLEPDYVVLDLASGVPGLTSGDVHVLKLETDAIASIDIKEGTVFDRITIRVADPAQLEKLPWPAVGKLVLRAARRHRAESKSIVRIVKMRRDRPVI